MDLLSDTLSATPLCCPECQSVSVLTSLRERGRLVERVLEGR